jgi:hypothetical protein
MGMFVYLAMLSRDWFPWYLLTAVGLGALLGGWWLETAATAGGSWLLVLHGGTAYLAELGARAANLSTARTVAVALFVLPALLAIAATIRRHQGWPATSLLVPGVVGLIALTLIIESPLVGHWADPAPMANLQSGRAPGPLVLSTALEWDDWSWGVSVDQTTSPPGQDGERSVCVTYTNDDGAFFAHHPGFSTRGYADVVLDLRSFGAATPPLAMSARGPDGQLLGTAALSGAFALTPSSDGWVRLRVPLATLGASDTIVTGLLIQKQASDARPTFCLQNMAFVVSA